MERTKEVTESLCKSCANVRQVVSGTGSTFLLCQLSRTDKQFPKYPPQPVVRCYRYEQTPTTMSTKTLEVLTSVFAICRLDADAHVSKWATGEVVSITRTPDELSIVCRQDTLPQHLQCDIGWRCMRVVGKLDFSIVGVMAALTETLAAANVSVFVVSTFDTDYLFVKQSDLDSAVESLTAAGYLIS